MKRLPAHGKAVVERRKAGERIGLLVVALHDWKAGTWFESRSEVARVVVPDDAAVDELDWSFLLALDVLVCGSAPDEVFYSAVRAVFRSGAASCWGEFADGVARLELIGRRGVIAVEESVPVSKLGAAMAAYRMAALALRLGTYRSAVFDGARAAAFGPTLDALNASLEGA